jgi:anti-repressor protein
VTELQPFQFPATGQRVRSLTIDGDPWFIGRDVCAVLGISNPADAMAKVLDEDEKGVAIVYTPGGDQQVSIINESGLYSLILRSRKKEAKDFKRWVTHEVLPALRKTGSYSLEQRPMPRSLPEALRAFANEIEAHEKTKADLAAARPLAEAYRDLMSKDGTFDWAATAQIFSAVTNGLGRNKFLELLRDMGILKANNTPYQRFAHQFKVVGDSAGTNATPTTTVKPAGLDWLRARLVAHFYEQGALFAVGGAA